MSKQTFTPGPWESMLQPWKDGAIEIVALDGALTVGEAYTSPNANLIAASPDLLAALEHAHNSLRTFRDVPKDEQEWVTSDDETMQVIEAAIAKAKGQQ